MYVSCIGSKYGVPWESRRRNLAMRLKRLLPPFPNVTQNSQSHVVGCENSRSDAKLVAHTPYALIYMHHDDRGSILVNFI